MATPIPDVSIVVPVFNEEENIPVLDGEICAAMTEGSWHYEVVYVDDGSNDGSLRALETLRDADDRIRVIHLPRNRGQSAALGVGFKRSRAAVIVTLDADLQNDPADIPRLLDALGDNAAVSGVRRRRRDNWLRRTSSKIANTVRRAVVHDGVTDVGCSLKAYRRSYLKRIEMFNGAHRFLPALIQMVGGTTVEIDVAHRPRLHGRSKYNIKNRLWRGIVDLFGVRWMQRRWVDTESGEELGGVGPD